MTEALLGLIATLVATMVWVVKRYGSENSKLVESLTLAVSSFREFEKSEDEIHSNIVLTQERMLGSLRELAASQAEIRRTLRRLEGTAGPGDLPDSD